MRLAELALENLPCGRWEPIRVLDLGCERGDSTRILQHHLPYATVHGTDETHWLGHARQVIGQAFLPPGLVRPDYELVVVLGTGETVRERLEEALRLTTRWVVAVAPLGVVRESEWQKWGFQAHREFGILPEDGVWWVGVYDRQRAVVPCERVLIAAPVRQQPEILQVFLEAQRQLDTAGLEVAYLFVDNNDDPRSTQILKGFAESAEHSVTLWHAAPGSGYQRTEHTHHWEVGIVWRLAALKDRILRYAYEAGYDALWILDSDLVYATDARCPLGTPPCWCRGIAGSLIRKISPQGAVASLADQLNGPCGVAVDGDGAVYVADTGFHRIRKLAPGAAPETIAGTAEEGFNGESGVARRMQLSFPTALAWDGAGRLLVADTGNHRIRRIEFSSPGAAPAAVVQPRVVHAATLEPGPFAAGQLLLVEGLPAPQAVWFDDLAAAPVAVNPGAFLVRIPPELAQRAAVRFTAAGYAETIRLAGAAPGLFPVEGEFQRGGSVLLRATGEGVTRLPVSVSVGGLAADVLSVEPSADVPGLLMVGIRIPAESPAGDVPVILRVGSAASPSIRIRVTP